MKWWRAGRVTDSRRRYFWSAKEGRLCRLGLRDCRLVRWKRGRRWRRRTRRKLLATRKRSNVFASERLTIEKRRGDTVQQVHVLGQRFLGAIVRFLDHARNFGVNELRRSFRNFAPRLKLAAKEKLLLVVTNENWTNRIGQSPLTDIRTEI